MFRFWDWTGRISWNLVLSSILRPPLFGISFDLLSPTVLNECGYCCRDLCIAVVRPMLSGKRMEPLSLKVANTGWWPIAQCWEEATDFMFFWRKRRIFGRFLHFWSTTLMASIMHHTLENKCCDKLWFSEDLIRPHVACEISATYITCWLRQRPIPQFVD